MSDGGDRTPVKWRQEGEDRRAAATAPLCGSWRERERERERESCIGGEMKISIPKEKKRKLKKKIKITFHVSLLCRCCKERV